MRITAAIEVLAILAVLLFEASTAKQQTEKDTYNKKIRTVIDSLGDERDTLINQLSLMSEENNRYLNELGYSTRGGTARQYLNKKQNQYIRDRKANLLRQKEISKQQMALTQLEQP